MQCGSDPNLKFNGFRAWQNCLYTEILNPGKWVSVLKLLLEHGSDPRACIQTRRSGPKSALLVIQEHFDGFVTRHQTTEQIIARLRDVEDSIRLLPRTHFSDETLAQLKSDISELKTLLVAKGAKAMYGDVMIGSGPGGIVEAGQHHVEHRAVERKLSIMYSKRVAPLVHRMLGRGHE